MYMYMRLIGYPAERITLLTTYNGQKALLDDVVARYCTHNPLFGPPSKVSTVDKYQGQQNDYVLLSLVRTRTVGHLRDVRRLVVATSRAKLGLYIFGCRALFEQCHELEPTFRTLLGHPTTLQLLTEERWGDRRRIGKRGSSGRGPGGVQEALGGIEVHSLPHLEGIVQGVADRIAAEVRLQVAAAGAVQADKAVRTAGQPHSELSDAALKSAHRPQLPPPMPAAPASGARPPQLPPQPPLLAAMPGVQEQPLLSAARPMQATGPTMAARQPNGIHMGMPSLLGPGAVVVVRPHPPFPPPVVGQHGPPTAPMVIMPPPVRPHLAGMAWGHPQMLPGPRPAWLPGSLLPPEAFCVPHFIVQAAVDAPPGEIIVGKPLKMKAKSKGGKAKKSERKGVGRGTDGRSKKRRRETEKGSKKRQKGADEEQAAGIEEGAGIVSKEAPVNTVSTQGALSAVGDGNAKDDLEPEATVGPP
jgi:hypothetical protein